MSRRTYGLLALGFLTTFCVFAVIANNFYWGATSGAPGPQVGEYYLFNSKLPTAAGQVLWLSRMPLLLIPLVATCWFTYRYFRAVKARVGFCPRCGYDLRGTPGRCPECGTLVNQG